MLTRELPDGTALRAGFAKWSRPLWMRLGALGAVCAALILLCAPVGAAQLRQAAQIQFMHAMSTFACATFMNVGGRSAKHALACFVAGSLLYSLPILHRLRRWPGAIVHLYACRRVPSDRRLGGVVWVCIQHRPHLRT